MTTLVESTIKSLKTSQAPKNIPPIEKDEALSKITQFLFIPINCKFRLTLISLKKTPV